MTDVRTLDRIDLEPGRGDVARVGASICHGFGRRPGGAPPSDGLEPVRCCPLGSRGGEGPHPLVQPGVASDLVSLPTPSLSRA